MIEQGHFLPGGTLLVADRGVNETYRGVVEVGEGRLLAYVKLLDGRQFVNELAASMLGRLAGLRLPRAFVVLVRQADYPASPFVQKVGGDVIAFATESVGDGSSALRRVPLNTPQAVALFLRSWKEWSEAATFDEWIANADRHPANFLVGARGEVWLIDHSHAFTGPTWTTATLNPLAILRNQICDVAGACMSATDKATACSSALVASQKFACINVNDALSIKALVGELDAGEHTALITFVAARLVHVYGRIAARLGLPALSLGGAP